MDIFSLTKRPDPEIFFQSHDAKDLRLGAIVKNAPEYFADAKIVILGCPQDEGVKRNRGRPGARKAPREIRKALYKLTVPKDIKNKAIFDAGDVICESPLEKIHDRLWKTVQEILSLGKNLIIIGGGNDISYPDCAALSGVRRNLLVFNIDRHFDVRDMEPRNSGTPYRLLLDNGHIEAGSFYELGSEPYANSPVYERYLEDKGVHVIPLEEWRTGGIRKVLEEAVENHDAEAIFWGFDMDVIRNCDAPGVSAKMPTGLTAEEIIEAAAFAGSVTYFGILEITELNPEFDVDGRTAKLAALMIHQYLENMARYKRI
jgi:formiminoglutamase